MGAFAGPERNVSLQTTSGRSLYSLGVVQDGLVINLDAGKFYSYPKSGTAWTDLTNNGRNGTLSATSIGYDSGNGGILTFDGTDDYVQCSGSLTLTTATFIVWMRRNGNQDQYDGILFSRGTNVTGMNFQSSNQLGYHWNGTQNTYEWNSGLTLPNLAWSMCAVSVSGSSATAYLCQSSGITSATNTVNHTSTILNDIQIARDSAIVFGVARYYTGNIAQASIYNIALTAGEIAQNFNATRSRFGI